MNYRSRQFLDLCYEFDCMLQVHGVCEGGTGEPCHANWSWAGKGGAMKAHDVFVVPGCRKCHMALDQGKELDRFERQWYWLRAFGRFLPALLERGLVSVGAARPHVDCLSPPARQPPRSTKRRDSRCTTKRALPRRYGP